MPGPVSDAYDPEWGTAAQADEIRGALRQMHGVVSEILSHSPPLYIIQLLSEPLNRAMPPQQLTEKEWRLIRFALERAADSI